MANESKCGSASKSFVLHGYLQAKSLFKVAMQHKPTKTETDLGPRLNYASLSFSHLSLVFSHCICIISCLYPSLTTEQQNFRLAFHSPF